MALKDYMTVTEATALCEAGRFAEVRRMIDEGVVEATDENAFGITPMHLAVREAEKGSDAARRFLREEAARGWRASANDSADAELARAARVDGAAAAAFLATRPWFKFEKDAETGLARMSEEDAEALRKGLTRTKEAVAETSSWKDAETMARRYVESLREDDWLRDFVREVAPDMALDALSLARSGMSQAAWAEAEKWTEQERAAALATRMGGIERLSDPGLCAGATTAHLLKVCPGRWESERSDPLSEAWGTPLWSRNRFNVPTPLASEEKGFWLRLLRSTESVWSKDLEFAETLRSGGLEEARSILGARSRNYEEEFSKARGFLEIGVVATAAGRSESGEGARLAGKAFGERLLLMNGSATGLSDASSAEETARTVVLAASSNGWADFLAGANEALTGKDWWTEALLKALRDDGSPPANGATALTMARGVRTEGEPSGMIVSRVRRAARSIQARANQDFGETGVVDVLWDEAVARLIGLAYDLSKEIGEPVRLGEFLYWPDESDAPTPMPKSVAEIIKRQPEEAASKLLKALSAEEGDCAVSWIEALPSETRRAAEKSLENGVGSIYRIDNQCLFVLRLAKRIGSAFGGDAQTQAVRVARWTANLAWQIFVNGGDGRQVLTMGDYQEAAKLQVRLSTAAGTMARAAREGGDPLDAEAAGAALAAACALSARVPMRGWGGAVKGDLPPSEKLSGAAAAAFSNNVKEKGDVWAALWAISLGADPNGVVNGETALEAATARNDQNSHQDAQCAGADVLARLTEAGCSADRENAKAGRNALTRCGELPRSESPTKLLKIMGGCSKGTGGLPYLLLKKSTGLSEKAAQEAWEGACSDMRGEVLMFAAQKIGGDRHGAEKILQELAKRMSDEEFEKGWKAMASSDGVSNALFATTCELAASRGRALADFPEIVGEAERRLSTLQYWQKEDAKILTSKTGAGAASLICEELSGFPWTEGETVVFRDEEWLPFPARALIRAAKAWREGEERDGSSWAEMALATLDEGASAEDAEAAAKILTASRSPKGLAFRLPGDAGARIEGLALSFETKSASAFQRKRI